MATPLIFDEINNLSAKIRERYQEIVEKVLSGQFEALNDEYLYEHPSIDPEEIEDEILDLLIMAWTFGNQDANEELSIDIPVDIDKMEDSIYRVIDGETFVDRIYRHANDGNIDGIIKVLETEAVHDYNDGKVATASESGKKVYKTWCTQLDDKVRETHSYLEGVTQDVNDYFYTYDGDKALYPTGFEYAENNVNCRCYVKLSTEE